MLRYKKNLFFLEITLYENECFLKFKSWTYEINLKGNNKINLCVYKKWKQAIRK